MKLKYYFPLFLDKNILFFKIYIIFLPRVWVWLRIYRNDPSHSSTWHIQALGTFKHLAHSSSVHKKEIMRQNEVIVFPNLQPRQLKSNPVS